MSTYLAGVALLVTGVVLIALRGPIARRFNDPDSVRNRLPGSRWRAQWPAPGSPRGEGFHRLAALCTGAFCLLLGAVAVLGGPD